MELGPSMAARATIQRRESQEAGGAVIADRQAGRDLNKKRYSLVLLIRHPTVDPATITAKLNLRPFVSWKAGDPRRTPTGKPISEPHGSSCWNYVFKYKSGARFSQEAESILRTLEPHKPLFQEIDKTGGTSELFLKLPGDVNIGDAFTWQLLQKFAGLRIGLSVETFPEMP